MVNMSDHAPVTVTNNAERHRYEATDDSGLILGFADYRERGDVVVFTHTEVDDAHEGQGVGSALAKGALDDVRSSGGTVKPACEFIAAYIQRHPDYQDLVAP